MNDRFANFPQIALTTEDELAEPAGLPALGLWNCKCPTQLVPKSAIEVASNRMK